MEETLNTQEDTQFTEIDQLVSNEQVDPQFVEKEKPEESNETQVVDESTAQEQTQQILDQPPIQPPGIGNDDQPIGQKSKFQISEFPDESEPVAPRKPKKGGKVPNKTTLVKKFDPDAKPDVVHLLDEVPVGGGKRFEISEYPDDMAPEDNAAEPQQLPLQTRLKSKVWKQRQSAFEEMITIFTDAQKGGSEFDEFYDEWPKHISDSNPGSQEKAMQSCLLFLQKCNQQQMKSRVDGIEMVKALIDKCISPGKTQIKKLAIEILCELFERREKNEIFDGIKSMMNNKNPKISAAAVQTTTDLLLNFGPKPLDYLKPFFNDIEKLAQSTTSAIRNECMNFYKEAIKWLGDQVLAGYTKNLKKAQQDEIDKFYAEWEKQPLKPIRGGASVEVSSAAGGGSAIDAYDIVDAVDIFSKFNEKWCDKVLALSKWNEKSQQLEDLIKQASAPRIVPAQNFTFFMSFIKKLLNDSNQQVNLCAIRIICCFVKGMRKNFYGQAKVLFPLVMYKLREKKTLMIEETKTTLEAMYYSVSVEDLIDDLKEGLADKTPQLKVQVLQFIAQNIAMRQALQPSKQKLADALKQLVPIIKKLLEDSVPEVREASLTCLGKIKPYMTDSVLNKVLNDINPQKLQKMNEIASQNSQSRQEEKKEVAAPSQSLASSMVQQQPPQRQSFVQTQNQPMAQSTVKQDQNQRKPPTGQKQAANQKLEMEPEPSSEEAEGKLKAAGLPDYIFQSLSVGTAKEKVETIENIQQEHVDLIMDSLELFLVIFKKNTKEFKDSNLQLNKALFGFLLFVEGLNPKPFNRKSMGPLCKFLVERMGDAKFKDDIWRILESCCSCVMPQYIVYCLIQCAQPKKENEKVINVSPKSVAEILQNITKILNVVSINNVPLKELLDFAKENAQQTNAVIKPGAFELLKAMYRYMGEDLVNQIQSLPAPILKSLSAEFEKITVLPQNERGRTSLKFQGEAAGLSQSTVNVFDQLPRADLSKQIEPILKKLSDVQWQKKKEAIEELDKLITVSGNRIQANGLMDLFGGLKQILSDKTKTLVRPMVNIVGRLAEATGKDFKNHGKQLIGPVIAILSDKQPLIRQDAVQALDRISAAIGSEHVIQQFPTYLVQESPEMKNEILTFISRNLEGFAKSEVKFFVQPIMNCLSDRSKDIRNISEQILQTAVDTIGAEPFTMNMKDLKPAVIQQIKPILQKYGIVEEEKAKQTASGSQRTNKTPKQKSDKPEKKLQRNLTSRDLNASLDGSNNGSLYESRHRSPGKSVKQVLPAEIQQPKASFIDGGLLATSVSIRDMKPQRLSNPDAFNHWALESFNDQAVQETINDMKICLRPELSNQLLSYDYKRVIGGLKSLSNFCTETVQKLNVNEVSDLLLKWMLMKVYGGCINLPLCNAILSFINVLMITFEKTGYSLVDLEVVITMKILREIVYFGQTPEDKLFTSLFKVGGDRVLKQWISFIQEDHQKIHKHIDPVNTEKLFFQVLKTSMINYFREDTLIQLGRLPQLKSYPDLVQELTRTYDQAAKKAGIAQPDPMSFVSQKINMPIIRQNAQQPSPRQQQFKALLNSLISPQVATKIESLMQINDRISQCEIQGNDNPLHLFVNNASTVCEYFHSLLNWSFTGDQVPVQYKQFLLNALLRLYSLQPYARALTYEKLCPFTEDLMLRLLAEDEHKQQYEQGDQFIKQLNSTTLRILENTDANLVYAILLDLLIKHRRKVQQQTGHTKVINLLVKCIMRVTKMLDKNVNEIKIDQLLLKFHLYMVEFSQQPNFPTDDVGMKTIKTILSELIKYVGERIWVPYQTIEQHESQDVHIGQWIQMLLMTTNQMISPRQRVQTNNDVPNDMKAINEMLKRQDSFEQGVKYLIEMIKKNPNINWQRSIMDLSKNVQQYVTRQVEQAITQPQPRNMQAPPLSSFENHQERQRPSAQNLAVNNTGAPQLRTPDYLMQRLNDMKTKVQNLVGTQPVGRTNI